MSGRATSSYTQSGFSLVELLVAMAIGLVTLAAILSIYLGTTVAGRQSDTVSRMSEDASIALETLSRHIRMAGYSRPVLMVGRNTATVNGQASQIADSHFAGAGIKGCDGGFNRTTDTWEALSCTNSSTQPDDIAVRYEGDSFNTEATANASASDCLGQGVADNANSAVTSSTQFTLIESRFFVSANKELSCAGNGNANLTSQPLVSGVEFMRIRYGIASDSTESQLVQFVSANDINQLGGNADQNWGRVVAVRICIQMVSPSQDQGKAIPYYNCDGTLTTPGDKYLHRAYSTTVSVRNRSGIAQ
jgi:type IV pilus assembly protein PilW